MSEVADQRRGAVEPRDVDEAAKRKDVDQLDDPRHAEPGDPWGLVFQPPPEVRDVPEAKALLHMSEDDELVWLDAIESELDRALPPAADRDGAGVLTWHVNEEAAIDGGDVAATEFGQLDAAQARPAAEPDQRPRVSSGGGAPLGQRPREQTRKVLGPVGLGIGDGDTKAARRDFLAEGFSNAAEFRLRELTVLVTFVPDANEPLDQGRMEQLTTVQREARLSPPPSGRS